MSKATNTGIGMKKENEIALILWLQKQIENTARELNGDISPTQQIIIGRLEAYEWALLRLNSLSSV